MLILVCGSRTWTDIDKIRSQILALATDYPLEIIQGGAKGADEQANAVANSLNLKSTTFLPDYDRYKATVAPLKRNLEMLDQKPDLVLAFQVGKSRGTQHTINHARKRGIPVKVYNAS